MHSVIGTKQRVRPRTRSPRPPRRHARPTRRLVRNYRRVLLTVRLFVRAASVSDDVNWSVDVVWFRFDMRIEDKQAARVQSSNRRAHYASSFTFNTTSHTKVVITIKTMNQLIKVCLMQLAGNFVATELWQIFNRFLSLLEGKVSVSRKLN